MKRTLHENAVKSLLRFADDIMQRNTDQVRVLEGIEAKIGAADWNALHTFDDSAFRLAQAVQEAFRVTITEATYELEGSDAS